MANKQTYGKQNYDIDNRILSAQQCLYNQTDERAADIMNKLDAIMAVQSEILKRLDVTAEPMATESKSESLENVLEKKRQAQEEPKVAEPAYNLDELVEEGKTSYKNRTSDEDEIRIYEAKIKNVRVSDCAKHSKVIYDAEKFKGHYSSTNIHSTYMYNGNELVSNIYDVDRALFGGRTSVTLVNELGNNVTVGEAYDYFRSNNVRKMAMTKLFLVLCGECYLSVNSLKDIENSTVSRAIIANIIPYESTVRDVLIDPEIPGYSDFN